MGCKQEFIGLAQNVIDLLKADIGEEGRSTSDEMIITVDSYASLKTIMNRLDTFLLCHLEGAKYPVSRTTG